MSAYAPVDDMDGKSYAEVLRELAWTRRQRNDGIAVREAHAKARGEAEHRRSKAERSLADARWSFRGALDALKPRTITTREELEALGAGAVILDNFGDVSQRRGGEWCSYETHPATDRAVSKYLPATVLWEPSGE